MTVADFHISLGSLQVRLLVAQMTYKDAPVYVCVYISMYACIHTHAQMFRKKGS